MIVTSVIVFAIVGSAFVFNEKKLAVFCTSGSLNSTSCNRKVSGVKLCNGAGTAYYVVDWDGATCNGQVCTSSACFLQD